jgi:undecaprenyl-diphosphatase
VIAGQGEIEVVPLIGVVWACAALGDSLSFLVGQRLGRGFLLRHGHRVRITHERFEQVERYLERHGGKTIVIGRFLGFVRPLAPFIAGSSRMPYRRFLPYSVVGTALWGSTFCLLGFFFYRSLDRVTKIAGRATLAFGLLVGLIAAAVYGYRHLREEEQRRQLGRWLERQGRRPLLRPLAAVLRPLWVRGLAPAWRLAAPRLRFLWQRLTPGNLGIEFTTAIAMATAGLYVFGLYAVTLSGDPRLTPADRQSLDFADDLRVASVVKAVKVLTAFGSLPATAAAVLLVAVGLAVRRHIPELVALAAGSAAVYASVHVAKAAIDRPRPPHPLVDTLGASFPSGHAAYSTAYVAIAIVTARVLPGLASRAALVASSLGLVVAVGLSRVYLHAHYWSDVLGGWALGFGLFGLSAAVALLVVHLRQNVGDRRLRPTTQATGGGPAAVGATPPMTSDQQ